MKYIYYSILKTPVRARVRVIGYLYSPIPLRAYKARWRGYTAILLIPLSLYFLALRLTALFAPVLPESPCRDKSY